MNSPTEEPAFLAAGMATGAAGMANDAAGAPKPVNVQKVVSEIHARVRREGNRKPPPLPVFPPPQSSSGSSQDSYELTALRSTYQRLYQNRNAVGKMPPSPNTLRARIGGHLIRGVQRCLFWYTPQIHQFQNDAISALNSVCNLIGNQSEKTTSLGRQMQRLRREILDGQGDLIHRQAGKIANLEEEVQQLGTTDRAGTARAGGAGSEGPKPRVGTILRVCPMGSKEIRVRV